MAMKNPSIPWPERILLGGVCLLIGFTAITGGAVREWSAAVMLITISLLGLAWIISGVLTRTLTLQVPETFWSLSAFTLFGLVQCISWTDQLGCRQSLSLDVEATRAAVLLVAGVLVFSLLVSSGIQTRKSFYFLAQMLMVLGLGISLHALILFMSRKNGIPTDSQSFGVFMNHNHVAGYLELIFPLPIAFLLTRQSKGEGQLYYLIVAVVLGVTLCFTLSRGGLISLCVQMSCLFWLSLRRHKRNDENATAPTKYSRSLMMGGLILAILLSVFFLGAAPLINRTITGNEHDNGQGKVQSFDQARGTIWSDSWRLFRAHPLLGVGIGAYETAFPLYAQEAGLDGVTAQTHNDYLQVLTDAGLVGASIALWFLFVAFRTIRRALHAKDPMQSCLAISSSVAIIGLLVHSFFDFNLQLPSHALLFLWQLTTCSFVAQEGPAFAVRRQAVTATPQATVSASAWVKEEVL